MSANKRLSKVLSSAKILPIDNSSKIVLMSDCHRGDGNWNDNFAPNQNLYLAALTFYYERGYTYIELGDGDELWENRKIDPIVNTHSDVFWLLSHFYKSGRFYMIYGNHDMVKKSSHYFNTKCKSFYCDTINEKIPLFPGIEIHEGILLKYENTNYQIFLTHGHQVDFFNDTLWRISRFLIRYLWTPLELIGIRNPTSASKNNIKKSKVEKRIMEWSKKENQMIITGHTHRPHFPKVGETLYFNDGSCVYPRDITAIEINNGFISLVKWKIKVNSDRGLYVGRDVIENPVRLLNYFEADIIKQSQIYQYKI